jgi:hypothetical protein
MENFQATVPGSPCNGGKTPSGPTAHPADCTPPRRPSPPPQPACEGNLHSNRYNHITPPLPVCSTCVTPSTFFERYTCSRHPGVCHSHSFFLVFLLFFWGPLLLSKFLLVSCSHFHGFTGTYVHPDFKRTDLIALVNCVTTS